MLNLPIGLLHGECERIAAGNFVAFNSEPPRSEKGVFDIVDIPDDIKNLYKTVWEISQKCIIDMAADRGAFIDQSQSLNIFMENANFAKLTSMHFYGWKKGGPEQVLVFFCAFAGP